MTDAVIDISNAVVSFREDMALRGISLKVKAGEFVGIIGPNGAGKTTLLTIVNGLGKLLNGSVRVLGNQVNSANGHELRKKVGYVAQAEDIDRRMPMNVREVTMIGRYGVLGLFKRPSARDWEIVDENLALVGMTHLAGRPIGHLSGGEQQRVAIARCLSQEPELFLLDEPTAALDWKARTEILELVRHIHDSRNLTTLFVTHDMDALPHTCDRVVLMKDGHIVGDGIPENLLSAESIARLYNMPEEVVRERRPHVHSEREAHHHR